MPRYHFNVYDGSSNLDHEGVELRDLNQAHIEALRCTAGIISDEARRRSLGKKWRLEVTDAQGAILLRLDLLTTTPTAPFTSIPTDKLDSLADEAASSIKQGVGKAPGNENLEVEGEAPELKGKTQAAKGHVRDSTKHWADKVAGKE